MQLKGSGFVLCNKVNSLTSVRTRFISAVELIQEYMAMRKLLVLGRTIVDTKKTVAKKS